MKNLVRQILYFIFICLIVVITLVSAKSNQECGKERNGKRLKGKGEVQGDLKTLYKCRKGCMNKTTGDSKCFGFQFRVKKCRHFTKTEPKFKNDIPTYRSGIKCMASEIPECSDERDGKKLEGESNRQKNLTTLSQCRDKCMKNKKGSWKCFGFQFHVKNCRLFTGYTPVFVNGTSLYRSGIKCVPSEQKKCGDERIDTKMETGNSTVQENENTLKKCRKSCIEKNENSTQCFGFQFGDDSCKHFENLTPNFSNASVTGFVSGKHCGTPTDKRSLRLLNRLFTLFN